PAYCGQRSLLRSRRWPQRIIRTSPRRAANMRARDLGLEVRFADSAREDRARSLFGKPFEALCAEQQATVMRSLPTSVAKAIGALDAELESDGVLQRVQQAVAD